MLLIAAAYEAAQLQVVKTSSEIAQLRPRVLGKRGWLMVPVPEGSSEATVGCTSTFKMIQFTRSTTNKHTTVVEQQSGVRHEES